MTEAERRATLPKADVLVVDDEDDLRERPAAPEAIMDLPVALGALLGFVVVGVVAWRAGQGGGTGR